MEVKEYLTVKELAVIFRVDIETIYRWLKTRTIPGVKIGGTWRISKADIDLIYSTRR